jgi:predicted PurR-regulated permease PerM
MSGNRSLMVLAAIAVIFLLYWGEPFFVPLLIGLLLSYALAPLCNGLTLLVRSRVLAAALVVVSIVALGATAVWAWSDDIETFWQKLPQAARTITKSLQKMSKPGGAVHQVQKAAAEVESLARTPATPAAPPAQAAPSPTVWQVLWRGWKSVSIAITQATAVLFLVFFMLASGDMFKRKVIAIAGERLSQAKDALRTVEEIDRQIRGYLAVVLVSNVLVGLGVWVAFFALGVEYAGLWGLAAGILHTAPYLGPAIIAAASLVAAFVQFEEWPRAFMVAGSTVAVATFVGTIFATWLASRTAKMNATASFVGLLFFGWLWGIWGVLLAIPVLAIIKTICDRKPEWKAVSEMLGP